MSTTTTTTPTPSPPYTGPSVPTMLASHTLASNIIKYHAHPTSGRILDDAELALLRRFVEHPEQRDAILAEQGIDKEGEGEGLQSLAGYIVLKHGKGDLLNEGEIEMLREWFAKGDVV